MTCTYTDPYYTKHIDKNKIKTVIECGTDIGDTTLDIQKYYNATVYALECNPIILPYTKNKLKELNEIHLIEKAAWDTTGKIVFRPVNINKSIDKITANSSCFKWNPKLYKKPDKVKLDDIIQDEISVDSITIDDLCTEYKIQTVDMLCMDIQGAELKALNGAIKTLKNIKYIITEVNYKQQYDGSCVYGEIVNFLNQRGFVITAEPGTDIDIKDKVFENVLFVKK